MTFYVGGVVGIVVHGMAFYDGNFALVRGDEGPSHMACSQAAKMKDCLLGGSTKVLLDRE